MSEPEPLDGVRRITTPKGATREAWLTLRKPFVGASQAAALMHEHPFLSLGDLAAEKRDGIVQGDNAAMARGRALEDAVATWWADECGLEVVEPDVLFIAIPAGGERGVLCATLDRDITGVPHAALEVKTTARYVSEPERSWYWQAQVQMLCADRSFVEFAVLDASLDLKRFTITENAADQRRVLDAAVEFWKAIDAGEYPDGAVPSSATLTMLYPEPRPVEHELSGPARKWIRALRLARKREAEARADAKTLKAMIEAEMRDAAFGMVEGERVVTLSAVHKTRLDEKRLRVEHPEIVAEYTVPATEHRLTLK
jgi:predicted phage-related endonuclease